MAKLSIENTTLTAIGDAIRERDKTTEQISVGEFANRIKAISTGGETSIPPQSGVFNPEEQLKLVGLALEKKYDNCVPLVLNGWWGCPSDTIVIPSNANGEPLLDTSKVTDMDYMFNGCSNLTAIPKLNTSKARYMTQMFEGCSNLKTIPLLNTRSVIHMDRMFTDCSNLTTIPELDTRNVTDMTSMFEGCSSLTAIPTLDTSEVMYMGGMFEGCSNLKSISLLNTSRVATMWNMFKGCSSLTTIPLLNTRKVANMRDMFTGCSNLTTIPQLATSNVENMKGMFTNCSKLSDKSLNNILLMCKNAYWLPAEQKKFTYDSSKYVGIGLSAEQLAHIKATPELTTIYNELKTAGWTD